SKTQDSEVSESVSPNQTTTIDVVAEAPTSPPDQSDPEVPSAEASAQSPLPDTDTKDSAQSSTEKSEEKDVGTEDSADKSSSERSARPKRKSGKRPPRDRKSPKPSEKAETEGNSDSEKEPSEANDQGKEGAGPDGDQPPRKTRKQRYLERKEKERAREAAALAASPAVDAGGLIEISPKGFGFLRESKRQFNQAKSDVFVTPETVRRFNLRDGQWIDGISKEGLRGPQLIELKAINGKDPEECLELPYFEELTAINPDKKLTLETSSTRFTTRVIDMIAPIGRGQRGLIVAPPRTGKTTILQHIADGILENYEDEMHLMVVLIDERPEEVTDFRRSFPNVEVYSSSNDSDSKEHSRIALLAIERAKRLVECGEHVMILMDSITRLARAFNSGMRGGKRGTASGGLVVGALDIPRKIFAAARNTREAGSLTIIATALIQTNSKADEAIFQEFKGTGNMELVLDRMMAQNYIYPAVDIHKSGTRREELLLPPHVLEKIYVIRRGLGGYKPIDAIEWLIKCMERYPSNAQMLMDIKTSVLS
ncbi:MAG: transcription termination factor Rho, partial [Verrucomicrobiota bacterium]